MINDGQIQLNFVNIFSVQYAKLIIIMMKRALLRIANYQFGIWSNKPKNGLLNELNQSAKTAPNLSHLIEKIKKENQLKPKLLPPKNDDKLTVVFELDEVLIYTFTPDEQGYLLAPFRKYDFYHQMDEYNALMSIYKRKNLDNFINYITEECQPVIFSQGVPAYVNLIMNLIDPEKKIKHVFNQQHCSRVISQEDQIDQFQKDLNLLGRDLGRVIYFDSKPLSYWMYPDNCVPLIQFRADQTMIQEDLNYTILDIEKYRKMKDVREAIRQLGTAQILKQANLL